MLKHWYSNLLANYHFKCTEKYISTWLYMSAEEGLPLHKWQKRYYLSTLISYVAECTYTHLLSILLLLVVPPSFWMFNSSISSNTKLKIINGMSLHGEGEGGLREREQSSWWCSYGTWRDHGLWISDKPHLCEVVTHPVVTNACLHLESSPIHK